MQINNLYLNQGKTILKKTVNFLGDNEDVNNVISFSGSTTIDNLKCSIINDMPESLNSKYSCAIEDKEILTENFEMIEFTIEGIKSSSACIYDFSLSEQYGINNIGSSASSTYLSISNNKLYGRIDGLLSIDETLIYNISSDATRQRNMTFRVYPKLKRIQILEDEQVLIDKTVGDGIIPSKKVHFKFKIISTTDSNITTTFYQIKSKYCL